MCGSPSSAPSPSQITLQQQQIQAQATASAAQLAEQQREFEISKAQSDQTLANTKALQDKQQAEIDKQAALTKTWETGRAAESAQATDSVNNAFAQFTPEYYNKFTQDYTSHYVPIVQDQADRASNATLFGLARSGNVQSQTAVEQIAQNAQTKANALSDINNQAVSATTQQRQSILAAKQNLMAQATSDATLGSPITPGSADAITANFNNTSSALSRLTNQAGDAVTTLQATPNYGGLGNIFGSAASGISSALSGNQAYNFGQSAFAAANATRSGGSSGKVSG